MENTALASAETYTTVRMNLRFTMEPEAKARALAIAPEPGGYRAQGAATGRASPGPPARVRSPAQPDRVAPHGDALRGRAPGGGGAAVAGETLPVAEEAAPSRSCKRREWWPAGSGESRAIGPNAVSGRRAGSLAEGHELERGRAPAEWLQGDPRAERSEAPKP